MDRPTRTHVRATEVLCGACLMCVLPVLMSMDSRVNAASTQSRPSPHCCPLAVPTGSFAGRLQVFIDAKERQLCMEEHESAKVKLLHLVRSKWPEGGCLLCAPTICTHGRGVSICSCLSCTSPHEYLLFLDVCAKICNHIHNRCVLSSRR